MKDLIVITIDGLIGSGKTTFLKHLEIFLKSKPFLNDYKIVVLREPVDEWVKSGMLEKFYSDKKRYAYEFQLYVLHTFFEHTIGSGKTIVIRERDTESVINIFTKTMYEENLLTTSQYKTILDAYKNYKKDPKFLRSTINVWLDNNLSTCMERIKKRGRKGEDVSDDYQALLYEKHCQYFNNKNNPIVISPPIDLDFHSIPEGYDKPELGFLNEIYQLLVSVET